VSFLTGSELKSYLRKFHAHADELFYGTLRTKTLTGLMGGVFYLVNEVLYLLGFAALTTLFALLYWRRLQSNRASFMSYLVLALTYSYAPLIMTQPLWIAFGVFVAIVLLLNSKVFLDEWAQKVSS
jgi:uncharacterized membrane protein (DUF4010 family)